MPSRVAVAQCQGPQRRPHPPQDVLRSRWLWLLQKRPQRQQPLLLELVWTRAVQKGLSALAPASLSTCLSVSGLPRQVWAAVLRL